MIEADNLCKDISRLLRSKLEVMTREYKFDYEKTLYNLLNDKSVDGFSESRGKTDAQEFYENYLKTKNI